MDSERVFALCVGALFYFLPYLMRDMPAFVVWIGIAGAVAIGTTTFVPINPRLIWPIALVITSGISFVAALSWLYQRYDETPKEPSEAIARLADLGWTVKPGQDDILFEVTNRSLPPMQQSSTYLTQLTKPFRLHFQGVEGLQGLHYLANIAGCTNIEINAGEFTDISELGGFSHLNKLVISQVPLNGVGTVDASALSSLVNLRELSLGMTRVRAVDFLAPMKNLKTLWLGQTLVTDVAPLSGLASLEFLDIRGTRVADLHPLSQDEKLKELSIGGEQIPGLANLANLKNLKKISIIEQRGIDLSPIATLADLEILSIWGPQQLDVSPLRNLTKLQELQLSGFGFGTASTVTDIHAIGVLQELTRLTLASLQVVDLRFIEALKNLEEINLSNLPVASIASVSGLTSLKKISLVQIPVVDVSPLLNLPALIELTIIRTPARADVLAVA